MITGLLFDKDGTLFDFGLSWNAWAVRMLGELSQGNETRAEAMAADLRFDRAAGRFHPDSFVIAGTLAEIVAVLSPHVPHLSRAALLDYMSRAATEAPMAEAVPLSDLMGRLAGAGHALGVATNDVEAAARAHLEQAGILEHFAYVVGADSGYGAKPDPGMCTGFCEALGLAPGQCAMVGDSLHDLHAGRAAGMRVVAVLTGLAQAEELAPHADVVLPDIGHLPDWLALQVRAG